MTDKSQGALQAMMAAAWPRPAEAPLAAAPFRFLEKYLLPEEIDRAWADAANQVAHLQPSGLLFTAFLKSLRVECICPDDDLRRVPVRGPVVMVANHPFGMVEGPIMGSLLLRVRKDVKFLANALLANIPELRDYVIPVDPFGGAAKSNWKPLRQSLEWLRQGGLLVTFPSGEVSSFQFPQLEIADPEWNENIARLIRITGACAIPAFFHGTNGPAFQIAGLIHPRLRTALLARELLNKRDTTIRVSIGRPIEPERLARLGTGREVTDYLRQRTHVLKARESTPRGWRIGPKPAPIAAAVHPESMQAELDRLPGDQRLIESGEYVVSVANALQIPDTLREIARLREIAFRAVGEGTGRSIDLDRFDAHYQHLWIWNSERKEVAGAYRLFGTDQEPSSHQNAAPQNALHPSAVPQKGTSWARRTDALPRLSREWLYTSTLFRYQPGLLESLHPALELGRSFVRPEAQKSYSALLLLWKGIGQYLARHPHYRTLFGPVSISREYNAASRAVMVSFLRARCGDEELSALVTPKRRFHARPIRSCDTHLLGSVLTNVEELSEVVADLEPDGKGVPVLLRQYLNLGGRILAFNVDAGFSDVVDGLVTVDLLKVSPRLLEKYLGKPGAAAFLAHHAAALDRQKQIM